MTNLEKLKAWQEKGIADGLMDVKLTDIPGWGLRHSIVVKIISGECKSTEVSDNEIENAACDLLNLLEWINYSVDITNKTF